jgi:hypothetical protein
MTDEEVKGAAVTDTLELADRYVSIWIQEDAERRRRAVSALWTEDAVHILQPPAARGALNGQGVGGVAHELGHVVGT